MTEQPDAVVGVPRHGYLESVTVLHAEQRVDRAGVPRPQRDWDTATRTLIRGVSMQPMAVTDARETRDASGVTVTQRWQMLGQPGVDLPIAQGDRVVWGELTMETFGSPRRWPGQQGGVHHVEVTLQVAAPTESYATGARAVTLDAALGSWR